MHWTADKPTRPGWYWFRKDQNNNQLLVDVRKIEEQMTAAWSNGLSDVIDSLRGEWSGPLERTVRVD
jgi:hypothetical protein